MTRKERLEAQLNRREKQDADRRARTRQLKKELVQGTAQERRVRLSMIGRLAEEAGLMDWNNDVLLRAFREVFDKGESAYRAQSHPTEHAAD